MPPFTRTAKIIQAEDPFDFLDGKFQDKMLTGIHIIGLSNGKMTHSHLVYLGKTTRRGKP